MSSRPEKNPKKPDKKGPQPSKTSVLGWKEVRVFVSSTFDDMHAERDYLVKEVFPGLREWCERRRLRMVDVDLRWGVTEADATSNKRVVEVCLRRIDDCRPFFICLLGQRYGWIPRRQDVGDETGGAYPHLAGALGAASVTEMEIQHSTVAGRHTQNAFFYLREPSYLADLPSHPPQLRQRIYTDEAEADAAMRKEKLRVLRDQKIPATGRPVRQYSARWDPGLRTPEIALPPQCPATLPENIETWRKNWHRWADVRVADTDVNEDAAEGAKATAHNRELTRGRLTDFVVGNRPLGEVILEDLQQAIAAHFPDHFAAGAQTEHQREMDLHEELVAAASQGFVGRAADLAALDAYADGDDARLLAVTAAGGIGKTTLLAKWIADRRSRGDLIFCRFIGVGERSGRVDSLLASLLDELREAGRIGVTETVLARIALPGAPRDPSNVDELIKTPMDVGCDDPRTLRAKLPLLLAGCGERGRAIVVIDALNQLDSGLSDLDWLPKRLPPGIKMIVSFKTGTSVADDLLARWKADVRVHECRGFENIDDRKMLVTRYLERHLKELDQTHLEHLVVVPGAENPLYLRVVLGELRIFGAFGQLRDKLAHDFGTTPIEAYTGVLRRLESDPAHAAVPPATSVPLIFGLLAHAHGGLPEAAIVDLVHSEVKLEASRRREVAASVALVLQQLRPYLARREGRVDFFYESFLLAAKQRYTRPDAEWPVRSGSSWDGTLANWCSRWDGLEGASQRYALRWLPTHLLAACRNADAAGVMADFGYQHTRIEKLGPNDVIAVANDFVELANSELPASRRQAVDTWQRFHNENAHLLGRPGIDRPEIQLVQRACAHADSSPVTRGGEAWLEGHGSRSWWFRNLGRPRDVVRNVCERVLVGHSGGVVSVALCPDGRRAVSASHDDTLRVWNLETGECLRVLVGHTHFVNAVVFCPDARRAISGSADTTLRVWDLHTGECLRVCTGHAGPVALHPDGRRVISGNQDRTLRVWDLDTGRCLRVLEGTINSVKSVTLCPDGRRAISVDEGSTLRVWDLDTGKCLRVLEGHTNSVCPVAIHEDGRYAVSADHDKRLRVWNLDTGATLRAFDGEPQAVTATALCAYGCRAISGSEDKALRVWDLDSGECLRVLPGHSGPVYSVVVSADSRRAVSASFDKTLRVWDLEADAGLGGPAGHIERVDSVSICAESRCVVSASHDKTMRVWDLDTGRCLRVLEGHTEQVNSVAVCADGRRVVSASHDKTIRVWDLGTGTCLGVLTGHSYPVLSVAACTDNRRVVSASNDHTLRVWDLKTGKCLHVLDGHTSSVSSVVLCPDGCRFVSASNDGTLRLWSLETGKCLHVMEGHTYPVLAVALCADGRCAVSGSHDRTLRVWDLETGKCLRIIKDCNDGVLAVSADGRRAASRSYGQTLRVLDLDTGECLHRLEALTSDTLDGHPIALSADGRRVVWGSQDHTLRAWDLERNESLGMWLGDSNFRTLAFCNRVAHGGDCIIAGCEDGSVCLFELMAPGLMAPGLMAPGSLPSTAEAIGAPTQATIASAPGTRIADWFRPKWRHSNPAIRRAATARMTNQRALAEIARNDKDSEVRLEAVARATDQSLLAVLARNDSHSEVRLAAAARVTDQSILANIARYATDSDVRRSVVERVTDQGSLADIAKNATNAGVRRSVVERVTDQGSLADIAKNATDAGVRRAVVERVTAQNILADIAEHDEIYLVRKAAVERLADQRLLEDIARNTAAGLSVSMAALGRVSDQNRLADIAQKASDSEVRIAAVERVTDQRVLVYVASNDEISAVRKAAVELVIDQGLLADVAKNDRDSGVREAAVARITDQDLLVEIARNATDSGVRLGAVTRVTHSSQLAHVAKNDNDPGVRKAAMERVTDQTVLADIIQNDESFSVREAVVERLTSQVVLADTAKKQRSLKLCKAAVERVTEQGLLADIAKSATNHEVRKVALERVTDQTLLADIAKNAADSDARKAAVERLTDPSLLASIAKNDENPIVRKTAALLAAQRGRAT